MAEPNWRERLTRIVLSWFSQREVKTPLSFYFRAMTALVVIVVAAIWRSQRDVWGILILSSSIIVVLCVVVSVFAWFRPKHLVYGETGHRAEAKFKLGTETKQIEQTELATLEGMPNPRLLLGE